jgi:superfamily II DNA or RNA helicase
MTIELLDTPPIAVAGGAVYPYSDALMESLVRVGKYDPDDVYSLGRVIGAGGTKRILVPRNMAPEGGNDLRTGGRAWSFTSSFVPRTSEQQRVIEETVSLLEDGHNFVVQAPTGWGKTAVGTHIIALIGRKTLVIINKDDIKSQWATDIKKFLGLTWGNGLGLIQGDKIVTHQCGIVLAFVQSIAKMERYNPALFADIGLVVVDECHRIGADFFSQSMFRSAAHMRFGLSATPDRSDGREEVIEAHIGPVMVTTTQQNLPAKVVAQSSPWQVPMVTKKNKKTGKNEVVQLPHSPGKCMHVV